MQPKYWVMQPGHVRKTVMGLKCGAQNCTFMLLLIRYHLFFDNQVSLSKPEAQVRVKVEYSSLFGKLKVKLGLCSIGGLKNILTSGLSKLKYSFHTTCVTNREKIVCIARPFFVKKAVL